MRKKVFITVKTYPTISYSYGELVCTAGFTEDGNFIRVYPIPFRKLENELKYIKYQWVEMDIEKNKSDFRPESYHYCQVFIIKLDYFIYILDYFFIKIYVNYTNLTYLILNIYF